MAAKITLTGKKVSPITTTKDYYRFDMRETGSLTAPKGLPLSSPVLYSVFIGLKTGKAIDILKLTEDQFFLIAGEVTMDLLKEICPGQIGVIAFNVQLLEHKEKNSKKTKELINSPVLEDETIQSNKKVVNSGKQNVIPEKKHGNPFYDEELKEKVHSLYDGKCTACSAKMDKCVARFKLIDQNLPPVFNNLSLICPDCYKKRKNPALEGFSVGPKALLQFMGLGMDQTAINLFLADFINKFVLVAIIESLNFREYWVPEKQPIIRFKVVNNVITDLQIVKNRIPVSS